MHTIIVGGGAAGLGAAWHLRQSGAQVTIIEKNSDLGGRCRSHLWNGHWCIRGAAAFVGAESEPIELAKSLGIYKESDIYEASEEHDFYVWHSKKGIVHLGEFNAIDILKSKLIPAKEKIALGAVLPKMIKSTLNHDERDATSAVELDTVNACEYFRRYSPSFVDYILEPIMNQFCGYGEEDYSLAWLMWLMGSRRAWSGTAWTFSGRGTGELTHALQKHIEQDDGSELLLEASVTSIQRGADGVSVQYTRDGAPQEVHADNVVVALPGSRVLDVVPDLYGRHRDFFKKVEYVPHHIFHLLVDKPAANCPFSLLLPSCEGYEVVSNVWIKPDHAEDRVVLYGEIKGDYIRKNASMTEDGLFEAAWADVARALPQFEACTHHDRHMQINDIALCSRRKGYTSALKDFQALQGLDRMAFAGDYLLNSTVGQSLYTGKCAADQLLASG